MNNPIFNLDTGSDKPIWTNTMTKYQTPSLWKSIWQVCNTFIPFFIVWYLMYLSLSYSYWLTLALSLPTAGFVVRIFIIQHDCGHGSFFKSRQLNDFLGAICGVITLTPYYYWRKSHAIHHATSGNLERRGVGDIYTMTVQEYRKQSKWGRLKYRLYRNPLILFVFAPIFAFLVLNRFPEPGTKSWRRERASIFWTNVTIGLLVATLGLTLGFGTFLLLYLPVMILASTMGMWLFFVQHQFEDAYWADKDDWNFALAALQGSSYYKLPKVLQWFTGNIGFHHIHHLNPRIPNYLLEDCHEENPLFQQVVILTLQSSLKSIFLSLWDEEQKKLVGFGHLKLI